MDSLKFVFKYARRYIRPLALTVVSMLLLVGVQLTVPWIVRTMVATVTDSNVGPEAIRFITQIALLALAIYIVRAGLRFLRSYMAHVAGWSVVADVRKEIKENQCSDEPGHSNHSSTSIETYRSLKLPMKQISAY